MDKEKGKTKKEVIEKKEEKQESPKPAIGFQQRFVGLLADEIAKTVIDRLPKMLPPYSRKKTVKTKQKKIENPIFLDTSAIIDGRIFDIIRMGLFNGTFVIAESILLELKHIADSQDPIKKERGRKGLEALESIKKAKNVKIMVLPAEKNGKIEEKREVDEELVKLAKNYKGKVITCDYNLEKAATIKGVTAVNIHALAQALKVAAIPGELLTVKVLHAGKDETQGVGYLDDGTMIVVEKGSVDIGKLVSVAISRVIQTASGKILFARKQ